MSTKPTTVKISFRVNSPKLTISFRSNTILGLRKNKCSPIPLFHIRFKDDQKTLQKETRRFHHKKLVNMFPLSTIPPSIGKCFQLPAGSQNVKRVLTCRIVTCEPCERVNMSTTKSTTHKPWRKLNLEKKILRKKFKQEKLLKKVERAKKLEEIAKTIEQKKHEVKPPVSTVSVAVPSSILENAQSAELRTYVAGQIARAACIFQIDEIIVFDDIGIVDPKKYRKVEGETGEDEMVRASCLQLARILQYLECPQYLRKFFFPLHKDLQYSGLLNPLDAPHHLRQQSLFMYREGVVTDKKVKDDKGSYVNAGLFNDVLVDQPLKSGLRVTVRLNNVNTTAIKKKLRGIVVPPTEPRLETGIYWGYNVRIARSLSQIFTKSPYKKGYDLTIGTSDKGSSIHEVENKSLSYNHALIVFGGLKGLEAPLEQDEKLKVNEPKLLFDHYLNVVPSQGSRTIRTEEALLISLAVFQEKLAPKVECKEFDFREHIPQSEDTGSKQVERNTNVKVDDLSRFD